MSCPVKLVDSNVTGLAIAEEACPGVLPDPETDTVWYEQEPNGYNDFSTNIETTQRKPISVDRQNQKGVATNEDVSGGFNTDKTKSNLTRLLQGFFFADARQPASIKTQLNGTTYTLNSADMADANGGLDDSFNYVASHLATAGFAVGDLINKYGWDNPLDNELAVILTVGSTALTCTSDTVRTNRTIASPPAAAGFEVVGVQLATADLDLSFVSDILTLTSSVYDFTTNVNLFEGQWLFVGGDATANKFVNNQGYARIRSISANAIILEEPTWTPVTELGTGLAIRLFFGVTIKNENVAALIKKKTYQLERSLGNSTEGNPQVEYLEGCVANEFNVNIPAKDKITADLNYVGATASERTGLTGDLAKLGSRVAGLREEPINTSTDVFLMRMGLTGGTSLVTTLFAYITEGAFSISNGATAQPAVGILGALDITVGNITIGGSVTAYFSTVTAKTTIRNVSNVSMTYILAKDNTGNILDIPQVTLSGGNITVERDNPITIPLDTMGSENQHGFTGSYTEFRALPDAAMPVA